MSDFSNENEDTSKNQEFVEQPLIKDKSIESRLYQNSIFNSSKGKNSLIIFSTSVVLSFRKYMTFGFFLWFHIWLWFNNLNKF